MTGANRRSVLLGVGAAGVSAAVAACGGDGEAGPGGAPPDATAETPAPGVSPSGGNGAEALAKVSDVPVGGGIVLAEQKVVLTQPAEGEIKAFSSVCTHRSCTLADVTDGTINCGCHGSKFSPEDGAVRNGPATRPLPAVRVAVEGDKIVKV